MVTSKTQAPKRRIRAGFREAFLLERAQRAVLSRSPEQQARIRELTDAVDSRLSVADSLAGADQAAAALVLLRDSTTLAIRAVLESLGVRTSDETPRAAFEKLAVRIESNEVANPPKELDRVREVLSDTRRLVFDELSSEDAQERRSEVENTVGWLRSLVDARSLDEIKVSRALRIGTVAILFGGLLGWIATASFSSTNVALGKPVQASSKRPNCPSGSGDGIPASGAVDGNKSGAYDVCTNFEYRPWITVDLQEPRRLTKAIVYYRTDCCQGAFDLPAVLELSEDGQNFTEVGRRTTAYSTQDPWVVPIGGNRARMVRLRVDSEQTRELVLNEIELYAQKWPLR